MKRRDFIALIGGGARRGQRLAGATVGQDTTNWRVDRGGRRRSASTVPPCRLPGDCKNWLDDIVIETRYFATSDAETLRRYAKELVALQPDLLLSQSTNTTDALLNERTFVQSFSQSFLTRSAMASSRVPRPGGNVTRLTISNRRSAASGSSCSGVAPSVTRVLVPRDSATLPALSSVDFISLSLRATASLLRIDVRAAFVRTLPNSNPPSSNTHVHPSAASS